MALFDNLFTESVADQGPVDYLKDLPLAKFSENMSLMDCGSKGLVLAEAGWLDICETINNMNEEALDESIRDVADNVAAGAQKAGSKVADVAKKAGTKIKAGARQVAEFMKKVPEYLKKIAQNIFGTINKFLQTMKGLVTGNANLTDAAKAKAGLERYNKVNAGKSLKVKGFMFAQGDYMGSFAASMKAAQASVEKFAADAVNFTHANDVTPEKKDAIMKEIRATLVGSTPANGPVTSQSFKTDLVASFGKKEKDMDVTPAIIDVAAKAVKAGYKDEQNTARAQYRTIKEAINKWIGNCKKIASEWEKVASEADKQKAEDVSKEYNAAAKNARLAGQTMTSCAGIFSSYEGAFLSLLHQQYNTYLSIMRTCIGYASGGKAGEKVYGENKNEATVESDASLFGLDLI